MTYTELTLQEQVDRMNNRVLSGERKETTDYVQGLYDSGARMWTKDMFHKIEEDLAKSPLPTVITVRCMDDKISEMPVPDPTREIENFPCRHGRSLIISFKLYQTMVWEAGGHWNRYLLNDEPERNDDPTLCFQLGTVGDMGSTMEFVRARDIWDETWQHWIKSEVYDELVTLLKDKADVPSTLNKIVCFGLGSVSGHGRPDDLETPASCDGLPSRGPITQHAAALTMSQVLGERLGTGPLPVLVQDPIYSPVDKELLAHLGMEVAGGYGALGFTRVDDETLVFSCHPDIPVRQIVADIAKPAAMLWNKVRPVEREKPEWKITTWGDRETLMSPWCTDEDSPRIRELVEDYEMFDFPTQKERFGELAFYFRKY